MEKRMKLRVPKIVRSSFSACRPRELYDVVETSTFTSQSQTTNSSELITKAKTKTPNRCPPLSPIFPPNPFYEGSRSFRDHSRNKTKKTSKKKKKRPQFGSDSLLITSRFHSTGSWYWSCSDDEESDDETLFSSRSFSSSEYSSESFAVVKKSKDPYEDFRTSMVEMIIERQIFAAAELQQLLQCFISLNSHQHHNVIVQVFLDIYSTLFSS